MGRQDDAPVASLSHEFGYPCTTEEAAVRIESLLRSERDAAFLAESVAGRVLGWIHVFLAERLESEPFAEIGGLVVTKGFRRQGIGNALVRHAERWARERGIATMRIRSRISREDAHSFYSSHRYLTSKTQMVFTKALSGQSSE